MKKIIILLFSSSVLLFSCHDMLEEDTVSQATYDLFKTESGVEQLVNGAYNTLRFQFNGEQSFTLWNYGVDEYIQASDGQNKFVDAYTNQLNSTFGMFHDMWTAYYQGINTCNTAIKLIPEAEPEGGALSTEQGKNSRIAELRFLRGYYYFMLVQQFGSIPLTVTATEGVNLEFPKSPVADIYSAIIKDMRAAEAILPVTQANRGRITQGAARHFLAKVYLTRGSAVNDERGQKETDLDSAAYYADLVINQGTYSLVSNFADLWNVSNEASSEVILSAQFNNNALLLANSGNRVHLYFQMVYDGKPGMERDITYGRPFRRLKPTPYTIDIFDRKNDSRFYKSFRTVYLSNDRTAPITIPKWEQADADAGYVNQAKVGTNKFNVGDTAVIVTVDKNVNDAAIKSKPYLWIPQNKWNNADFLTLIKWMDPTRLDVGTEFAGRDGLIARLGETYLIAAEAYGRLGEYGKAADYINILRNRAAYKAGEVKPFHFYKSEGGTYGDVNSTAPALQIDASYWDNDVALEQYPPSASSTESRFIHFILNERTRELLGELHRWNDLVRTETFYERVKQFHSIASANVQEFHKLRPIPQAHLERVFINGKPLTPDERAQQQNAGY
ncbi:RagB/SusD family nutrient uptake outer membrane protein [Ohtaekwangia koreensis]|uniref:Starch-binding associating with outer membrane n=1 Tax=Ohtaekwangia koreensis TaxID=688867 RepID=A0A1T5MEU6_9BACT|nr:RagB/SusD family nutrient uptake outer membrane protein [Ohtaekwangia koreensis]SKC86409.1 Starch-binding associating with outer membrane [Ohtaekwangia koreensis]